MYHLVYGFLYLLSLLHIRVLYVLSDGLFGLVYYVIGYRKEVVMHNLAIAFPDKSEAERVKIARQFYHNFIDNFIETIKMISASDEYIYKRFTGNWEVVNEVYKTGRSCHLLLGHTFNWEWGNHSVSAHLHYTFLAVYMPIRSKLINRLFLELRSKGKTVLLAATNMRKEMIPYRKTQYALGLAADQNPGSTEKAFWANFFGRPAPFVTGPEKGARGQNLPVLFCYIEKRKRGFYHIIFSMGEENPKELPEGVLMVRFIRYLEEVIRMQPSMWLWSHKRWKHPWKEEYKHLWIDGKREM